MISCLVNFYFFYDLVLVWYDLKALLFVKMYWITQAIIVTICMKVEFKLCMNSLGLEWVFWHYHDLFQYTRSVDLSHNPYHESSFKFYDHALADALDASDPSCELFFRLLALCHTVMSEDNNGKFLWGSDFFACYMKFFGMWISTNSEEHWRILFQTKRVAHVTTFLSLFHLLIIILKQFLYVIFF